jgi:uncharacterized protein involved in high-affinity Fe2+ transport
LSKKLDNATATNPVKTTLCGAALGGSISTFVVKNKPRFFMKKTNHIGLLTLLALLGSGWLHAQMVVGTDTLYGNEWIDYNRTYYKIQVAQDGIYRIDYQILASAGLPLGSISGNAWRLYRAGRQEPIFVSTDGPWASGEVIEFWGERNRSSLDQHLFDTPEADLLNPWYGLFGDSTAYFLTWENTTPALRYTTVANDVSNPPAPDAWCWQTQLTVWNSGFMKRKRDDKVTYSWFDGEGFHKGETTYSAAQIAAPNRYTDGPDARVRLRYACSLGDHRQQVLLHDSLYAEDQFFDWKVVDHTFEVAPQRFAPTLKIELSGVASTIDRHAWAGVELRYPRQFLFENAAATQFEIEASATGNYLEINELNLAGGVPVCYDLSTRQRRVADVSGSTARFRMGASSAVRRLAVVNPTSGVQAVTSLRAVQFRDYRTEANTDFLILSNSALYNDPQAGGANQVAAYADYRRSAEGGNHVVTVADVNEVYEQFGYGARYHPLGVRNFFHFLKKKWTNPQHVLIIGKGLSYEGFRAEATQQALADSLFFVPMYGSPAVDQCFVMRRGGISEPIMAIGRLAATRPHQVADYLAKVREHENVQATAPQTIEDRAWMKRVIHISGGLAGETALIRSLSEQMGSELTTNRYGADIRTFFKTSNDPIQTSAYEQIKGLIRQGVSLWMIYGHSSTFAVDFDIGAASLYENAPRYPYMMILGCFTGTCSLTQRGLGEEYIFTPGSGAIAYSASTNFSYIDGLYSYGRRYYERLGGPDYGQSIGTVMQHTIGSYTNSNYPSLVAILHQNVLQGDPSIRLSVAPGPDYVLDNQSVVFNPNPIPTEQAKYGLTFDVANIGENVAGQVAIRVDQRQPDNSLRTVVRDTIAAPALRQRVEYQVATDNSRVGFHRFLLQAEPVAPIAEAPSEAQLNNQLRDASGEPGVPVYFYSDAVQPVYPTAFGIVGASDVTLSASTLSNRSEQTRFLFELDTLETFNSPFLRRYDVRQAGGLLQWKPDATLSDSTVYYWRVARDSLVNGSIPWRTQSFVHLKNSSPGWNQSDFGQYATNELSNLQATDSVRRVEFIDNFTYLICKVGYRFQNVYPGLTNAFYEGFTGDFGWNFVNVYRGVCLMVHNPATGHVVTNPANGPYNSTPGSERHFFYFNTADSLQRIAMMQFIENEIPTNSTVGLLALHAADDQLGYDPENWGKDSVSYGKNLFQILEQQGASKVRELAQYTAVPPPYGLIFRKNDPAFEAIDTFITDPLGVGELRRDYQARWFSGQMSSQRIGPATRWGSLHFEPGQRDNSSDEAILSLYGERPDGQTDTLLLTLAAAADTSLAAISTQDFPFLKIKYNVLDTTNARTATPLRYARVLYQPVPEGALHPTAHLVFESDTLEQGQNLRASVAFANVSDARFDSLLVKYRFDNAAGNKVISQRYAPLEAGDTLHTSLNISTLDFSGRYRVLIDINPDDDQAEQFHFNNVLFRELEVRRDRRNPLLDVTFDGIHLLDGDLVSPRPQIVVSLKDDNRYLAMTDTALLTLRVIWPDGSEHPISFAASGVQFFPADASDLPKKNTARVEWQPTFGQDGTYQLRVQGRDMSGNTSASLDYSINFEVITRSSLSNLLNYPNPFSTSTCFVYTMTGADSPAQFKLQIMTVSGRVVREVTAAEFGPLTAGRHQSNFCWDGRDDFGDQLANGVYLYRVVARKADGTPFEFFENQTTDGFFKGGFGKMVLMR